MNLSEKDVFGPKIYIELQKHCCILSLQYFHMKIYIQTYKGILKSCNEKFAPYLNRLMKPCSIVFS